MVVQDSNTRSRNFISNPHLSTPSDPLPPSPWRSITQTCHTMTTVVVIHRCATSPSLSTPLRQARKMTAPERTTSGCPPAAAASLCHRYRPMTLSTPSLRMATPKILAHTSRTRTVNNPRVLTETKGRTRRSMGEVPHPSNNIWRSASLLQGREQQ